ncbi:hypothetical protein TWF281_005364 [Arthrobotrys megalospora]
MAKIKALEFSRKHTIYASILALSIAIPNVHADTVNLNPTLVPIPLDPWIGFLSELSANKSLKDQVYEAQLELRGIANNCPADQRSQAGQGPNPPNSLNFLIQGAKKVVSLFDRAITSNNPSEVGFGTVEDVAAERAKLEAYIQGIIKFQRDFLTAVMQYSTFWMRNIDLAENWVYYAKGDPTSRVVYAARDGPSLRAGLARTAEDIGKQAIEYIRGAAQWAGGSAGNEAFNNLLVSYNPDLSGIDYRPGTQLWREGTGWTEPGSTTDMFTLQTLFDRMADWFGCWVSPLPKFIDVLEQHPSPPDVTSG